MASNKPDDKKTMDVAKPGESTPDISSRPVLISHHPMIKDPMVTPKEKPADAQAVVSEKPSSHGERTVQPLKEQAATEELKPTDTPETKTETAEPSKSADETAEETEPADDSEAVVDAVASQADVSSKRKEQQLDEAEKAKQEALQKLIEEKKYFVPIGQVSRRRNSRRALVALVLIILLAAAGAYLVVDAGLVKTTVTLPVDLIKN